MCLHMSGNCQIILISIHILREIDLAIVHKAECISDLFTKLEIILFLLSKCIICGTRSAKIEVESLFTEQTCVGFVPKGSTKNMS